jgi:1-acyl-sn-glycerol-3-phosphate acyltransferase
VWFLATDELFTIPVLGTLARILRAIPIRQDAPDRHALRMAEGLLARKEALVVFPEGHESLDGRLQPLQGGVMLLAVRSGASVVPVAITGSEKVLPPREWRPRHAGTPISLRFGRALEVTDLTGSTPGRRGIDQGIRRLEAEIRRLAQLGEARGGEPPDLGGGEGNSG